MPIKRFTATIVETKRISDQVAWFKFSSNQPMGFKAGQYVSLRFPGESRYHAFSIASSPSEVNTFDLLVKRVRDFTSKMFTSPPGTAFDVLGPEGRFLQEPKGDMVMVAGGVGVTPFLSMIRLARDAQLSDRQYWLFYSCRTRSDLMFEEELRMLPKQNPNIHVVMTLTRESPPDWDQELGHVTPEMLRRRLSSFEGKSFYTCGPGDMVDAIVAMLAASGVPKERILVESWG
jgi:ferredoxin-NADP reductase